MTFFPFGIPSTASFAETALIARDLYTPSYSAAYANVARKAPPGSPAANATDVGCPEGYTSAIQPTPGYTPVPTNPNVNRSGYVLCFQLPPEPSLSPTPTVTPSFTPTPTPTATLPSIVCYSIEDIRFSTGLLAPDPIDSCNAIGNDYDGISTTIYSDCETLDEGCVVYQNTSPCADPYVNSYFTDGSMYYQTNALGAITAANSCND
jgi:hypothetical protein